MESVLALEATAASSCRQAHEQAANESSYRRPVNPNPHAKTYEAAFKKSDCSHDQSSYNEESEYYQANESSSYAETNSQAYTPT